MTNFNCLNTYDKLMLLGRLEADCRYYLGFGGRSPKHLFYGDVKEHIQMMKDLYNSLSNETKSQIEFNADKIALYEADMTTDCFIVVVPGNVQFSISDENISRLTNIECTSDGVTETLLKRTLSIINKYYNMVYCGGMTLVDFFKMLMQAGVSEVIDDHIGDRILAVIGGENV